MIRITTSIPISLFNGWIIAGVGYGDYTDSGFLSHSSLSSSQVIVELYNSQQSTIFGRELTKLLPYESSNAVPAKIIATRCVRRVTSYMRHHNIPTIWNSIYRTRLDRLINVCQTMRVIVTIM
jgi:hypothetical protein